MERHGSTTESSSMRAVKDIACKLSDRARRVTHSTHFRTQMTTAPWPAMA